MKIFTLNSFLKLTLPVFFVFLTGAAFAQCSAGSNITQGGSVGPDQNIPFGTVPAPITESLPASGGNTNVIEYLWMFSTSGGGFSSTTWQEAPGVATLRDYQPGALTETTYFIRCARRNPCDQYGAESNIVIIIVDDALPVELTRFTAETQQQNVMLRWETASEKNHDFFTVEHSSDGAYFLPITTVKGDGIDRDETKNYSFMHRAADAGTHYYRLRQTDADGSEDYSFVVKAEVLGKNTLSIAPNPTFDLMTVRVSELPQSAAVLTFIHAHTGQQIYQADLSTGSNTLDVDTSNFAPGIYFAQILSNSGSSLATSKFVKAN